MSFGQRLKELRRGLDLSQAGLADRAGCSVEMLRKVEADKRKPSRELAARLAEVLDLAGAARTDFVRYARGIGTLVQESLPSPPTRLIGRDQDLHALGDVFEPYVRLVTLIGPPGVGKTRLAVEFATSRQADYRDGVVFVGLAPIHDPALVVEAIAEKVGARGGGTLTLDEVLLEHLRARQLLLVLDNFEQVLEARSTVASLISAAAQLRIVVTSRQALDIYGEHCFEVPPLGVEATVDRHGPQASAAETLFLERARAIRRGYARDARDQAFVAELCRRLNGLPLAIELAASRARTTGPAALLDQLGHSLDVQGPADYTARQRSMRGALDWSYDLLSEAERAVFAGVSVFVGGVSHEAAAAVIGVVDAAAVVDSLADQSLLEVSSTGEVARFNMLEIVREYAAERLASGGHEAGLRRGHAEYFAALALRGAPELIGPRQIEWLQRLDAEHDNFRAALDWSLGHAEPELAGQLCAGLWCFWRDRGFLYEGRRWLVAVVGRTGDASPTVRAAVLTGAGTLALLQSDYLVATDLLSAARDAYAALGDTAGLALALSNLGIVAHDSGDMDRAQALFENSLSLRQQSADAWGEASSLLNLGMIDLDRGAGPSAQQRFATSAALFRRVGDMRGLAQALSNLGWTTLELHDYRRATTYLSESLGLAQQLNAARLQASNLSSLALIAWYTRDFRRAHELFVEGLALFADLGDKRGVAESLEGLAGVAGTEMRPREAARLLGCAGALREAFHAPLLVSDEARYATAIETAREQLDTSAWQSAWDEGRGTPSEELVAQLLDGSVRMPQ